MSRSLYQSVQRRLACGCLAALLLSQPVAAQELNHIVAIVNDGIIVASELQAAERNVSRQLQGKGAELPPADVLRRQVLERLIVEKLQLQIADHNGMAIDESTLNDEVANLASNNNLGIADFRAVLERDGFDFDTFRDELRRELLIQQVRRQMVANRVKVSEQEVDNLLATLEADGRQGVEYRLSHILVALPEAPTTEELQQAEQRALDIRKRVLDGADFAAIAVAESDAQTALEGGDIGWRSIGQMPSLFVEPVKSLQVGEVSELIRSPGGFHLVMLTEKRGDERHIMRQTRVRHILLKADALNSDEDNLDRIRQLEIRLRGGDDFASLARANSQDTLSAAKGGDLGWIGPGETVPEFEEAVNGLAPGEISKPVKSRFGWHLLQVLDHRERDNTEEFERNKARNLIRTRKYDEELLLWIRRLRDEAYIEYRLDDEA